jgi:N-acetylglucosaminyl-diphospho-decaprenol L-rhamnosyltransferase
VVLVHWNQPDRCADTIVAFQSQDLPVSIVVVDNGSSPDAFGRLREVVEAASGDVTLIPLGANTGFGPAANVGFRHFLEHGTSEWVALAPHDALPQPGSLRSIIDTAEAQDKVGLACADVGDGETPVVDPYFGGMTKPGEVDAGWEAADYPHGTLLIARRGCLEDIGLFDERYFAYCEEADLGLRATKAGWAVGLVRGARVVNPSMRSGSPVTDYLMHRNTLLLVLDHSGPYHAFIRFNIAGIQLVRGIVQPSSRAWLFSAKGRAWGMLDFVRGHYGAPPAALFEEAGEPAAHDVPHLVRSED